MDIERRILIENNVKLYGAIDGKYPVCRVAGVKRSMPIHLVLWILVNGPIPTGKLIDHRDRNTLNFSINNLRLATYSQNRANANANCTNKLQLKGVSKNKGRFRSLIKFRGKQIYLGSFSSAKGAAAAYDRAAIKFFGKFAKLNAC